MHPSVLAAVLALTALPASAVTVDQIIARYLQARGGIEKIRAVQTLRFTGRMTLPDVEAPIVFEIKRPNRMRTEFVFQGNTGVRAFDGQKAWMVLPVPGLDQPQLMPPDEARDARDQADIDLSPLVDPQAKGFTVELVGREGPIGKEMWKLRVTGRGGPVRSLFIDSKTSLVVRSEETRSVGGQDEDLVTVISDYRPEGGLLFPHSIQVGPKQGDEQQRFIFDKIEVNVPVDDARFAMPAARAR
jgi:outer membrane lipoprotein-sorting protein